ncbi:MAG: hypothetical protein MI920_09685 [Kiloniellales bacterium]|nr:hypothetical protein [Kiloniellales bacterium]
MTRTILATLLLCAFCLIGTQAAAQDYPRREPVTLPPDAKAIFLAQMLGHMVSLDAIVMALGEGDHAKAAEIADTELGVARFQKAGNGQSKDEGPGLGIGQHLPEEFRAIGRRFREASSDFAALARSLPEEPSPEQHVMLMKGLSQITNQCRICHDSYRIE